MPKIAQLCLLIFITSLLQACSTIKVSHDFDQSFDFSNLKSYAWKPGFSTGIQGNDLVEKRIKTAIEKELSAKQIQSVDPKEADFHISYGITIEQKLKSSNVTGGISLGRSIGGSGYGSVGISSGNRVKSYKEGTLLVDITTPDDKNLLWRANSTQSISDHADAKKSTAKINETVAKMFAAFPPKVKQ